MKIQEKVKNINLNRPICVQNAENLTFSQITETSV